MSEDVRVELDDVKAWINSIPESDRNEKVATFLTSILKGVYPIDHARMEIKASTSSESDSMRAGGFSNE